MTLEMWTERQEKIQTFFGPGVQADIQKTDEVHSHPPCCAGPGASRFPVRWCAPPPFPFFPPYDVSSLTFYASVLSFGLLQTVLLLKLRVRKLFVSHLELGVPPEVSGCGSTSATYAGLLIAVQIFFRHSS